MKGQGEGQAKGQIHLVSYNLASNCHRDFKLDSCFKVMKKRITYDLDLDLDLESSPKVEIFETSIKEN